MQVTRHFDKLYVARHFDKIHVASYFDKLYVARHFDKIHVARHFDHCFLHEAVINPCIPPNFSKTLSPAAGLIIS